MMSDVTKKWGGGGGWVGGGGGGGGSPTKRTHFAHMFFVLSNERHVFFLLCKCLKLQCLEQQKLQERASSYSLDFSFGWRPLPPSLSTLSDPYTDL